MYQYIILRTAMWQMTKRIHLEIAAEAISFQIALFVLVEFDLVLFSHGVSHHNATLGH